MTIKEAIQILDNETSRNALWKYENDEQRKDVCFEACQLAADELRKRQWISVKDRLPKSKTAVLAIVRNKYSELDEWYTFALLCINDNGEWEQFFGPTWRFFNLQYKVIHWMPLPEPPKTGDVDD